MMKRNLILFALVLVASTANAQWVDDLYAGTSKRTQTANTSTFQTDAASAELSEGMFDDYGVSAAEIDRVSSEELITSYEDALTRRLYAMRSYEGMDQSYWDMMQNYQLILEGKYDQDLYNIVVVGNEMWVEPIYITAVFTGDDTTSGIDAYGEKVVSEVFGSNVNYDVQTTLSSDGPEINVYVNYDPWNWAYSPWSWGFDMSPWGWGMSYSYGSLYWMSTNYSTWMYNNFMHGYWGGAYGAYWPGYWGSYWTRYYGYVYPWPLYGHRPNRPGHGPRNPRDGFYYGNTRNGVRPNGGTNGLGGSRGLSASTRLERPASTRLDGITTGLRKPNGFNTVSGLSNNRRPETSASVAGPSNGKKPISFGGVGDNHQSGTGVGSDQFNRRPTTNDNNRPDINRLNTNTERKELEVRNNNNNRDNFTRFENNNRSFNRNNDSNRSFNNNNNSTRRPQMNSTPSTNQRPASTPSRSTSSGRSTMSRGSLRR